MKFRSQVSHLWPRMNYKKNIVALLNNILQSPLEHTAISDHKSPIHKTDVAKNKKRTDND